MKRIATNRGRKYESNGRWFYIGWGGEFYTLHISMGRFTFTIEQKRKKKRTTTFPRP